MSKHIVIIGAGGHGRVVLETLRAAGNVHVAGFIDADTSRVGATIGGLSVLGPPNLLSKLRRQEITGAIVAIGDNRVRKSYAQLVLQNGLELINAIHPSAVIASSAQLGRNILVAANAVIQAEVQVADSVIINTSAVIEHECILGEACHICPAAALAGRVRVEEQAFVGMGSRVVPCLTIGRAATVGAGAVVLADVPPECTVAGVPARVIRHSVKTNLDPA